MSNPTILNQDPVMLSELKGTLGKIKKRDKELNFRAGKLEEYLNAFVGLKEAEAKQLFESIVKLDVPRLKEIHITKIVDLMPGSVEELKGILQDYPITVNNENLKKIIEVVKKFS